MTNKNEQPVDCAHTQDLISTLRIAESKAIEIAAELVRLDGMPSDDASDYSGRIPKKVLAQITRAHQSQLVRGNRIKISVADRIKEVITALSATKRESGERVSGNDNVDAWRLGEIVSKTADSNAVGDYIDRGLILLRLLKEKGYAITRIEGDKT